MTRPIAYLGAAALLMTGIALLPSPIVAGGTSNTSIMAGRTFILGGEQRTGMSVKAANTGKVPVEVLLMEDNRERSIALLTPGQSSELKVPAHHAALFRNASKDVATMHFRLSRSVTSLSMRYDEK
jgi:hypothetical protein